MFSTNVEHTGATARNTHSTPAHATHGNHKGRRTSKANTSCFIGLKNKLGDLFQAGKRLTNRVIYKIEDLLYLAGTKISESAKAAYDSIKNLKTPFRKNYVDANIFGCNIKVGRTAKVGDFFKTKA